jgi:putative membrane protein
MQALVWIVRFVVVVVLVWFAVKNHGVVTIHGLPGQSWEAPLVFVMLVMFVGGVILGLLAWIPTLARQRRDIGRLKKAAAQQAALAAIVPPPQRESGGSDIHGV